MICPFPSPSSRHSDWSGGPDPGASWRYLPATEAHPARCRWAPAARRVDSPGPPSQRCGSGRNHGRENGGRQEMSWFVAFLPFRPNSAPQVWQSPPPRIPLRKAARFCGAIPPPLQRGRPGQESGWGWRAARTRSETHVAPQGDSAGGPEHPHRPRMNPGPFPPPKRGKDMSSGVRPFRRGIPKGRGIRAVPLWGGVRRCHEMS